MAIYNSNMEYLSRGNDTPPAIFSSRTGPCDTPEGLIGMAYVAASLRRDSIVRTSATSPQVKVPIVAGVTWAIQNPDRDLVNPEELPHISSSIHVTAVHY